MAHTFTELLIHVIFSTKDRVPMISDDLKSDLYAYMGGILREIRSNCLEINGTADHVHLLVKLPSNLSVSEVMRLLKTNSSRWVHEKGLPRRKFAWQTGYGAFTVSKSKLESVRKYITSQEEHHKKVSFKEEFLNFLKMHNIDYDERYIWE